ncbi:MAG: AAA family ATPase [Thermoplasmata archaeon]|nr:AAA family ATPase [Thermoplasmata archaeon]
MNERSGRPGDPAGPPSPAGSARGDPARSPGRPLIPVASELIGRESEVRQVGAFLDRTGRGDGGVLLVTGEAGVGKTRLLQMTRDHAAAHGMTVLRVACQDRDRGVAYAPWIELIREYVAGSPRASVYRTVSPRIAALAKLAPEIQDHVWLHDPDAPAPAEWERRNFLATLAQFFVAVSEDRPLVIAVDDVGWADGASLELLETVARVGRGSPLSVVGAYRDTHLDENPGLQALVLALERERWATTIQVRPLDPDALRTLVGAVLERPDVAGELIDLLYAKTRGNPFYTGEILQSLADDGTIFQTPEGWGWNSVSQIRLPTTVAGTIAGRLERLDEESLQVVRIASLLGLEFSFGLLERVADLPQERLLTALERAQRVRLVRERGPGGAGIEYEFSHPLIQEVLEAELSQARARVLHLRAARVLEASYGAGAVDHAAVLAYHFLRADDRARALEFSVKAGDRASAVFARSEAAGHYRSALGLLPADGEPELRCRLQEGLADQERGLADVETAARQYEEAADNWEKLGKRSEAAECLRRAADCWPGALSEVSRFLQRSRRLLDGEPPGRTLVAWYLSNGTTVADQGHLVEAEDGFRQALALARSIGDPRGEACALLKLAYCVPPDRRAEFSSLNDEAEKIIAGHGLSELNGDLIRGRGIYAYHCVGDLPAYIGLIDAIVEFARKSGDVELESYMRGFAHPWVYLRTGDFRRGLELVDERRRSHRSLGLSGWAPTVEAMGVHAYLTMLLGPLERGEALLAETIRAEHEHPLWRDEPHLQQFLGRLRLLQGRPVEAVDALEASRRIYLRGGPPAWHALFLAETLRLLVRALVEVGRTAQAQETADELGELAKRFDSPPAWAFAWRGRAACALAAGDGIGALALLEKSRAVWERLGWKYDLAGTWFEIGQARSTAGESAEAERAFREALTRFRDLGAQPDAERVMARLELPGS